MYEIGKELQREETNISTFKDQGRQIKVRHKKLFPHKKEHFKASNTIFGPKTAMRLVMLLIGCE